MLLVVTHGTGIQISLDRYVEITVIPEKKTETERDRGNRQREGRPNLSPKRAGEGVT